MGTSEETRVITRSCNKDIVDRSRGKYVLAEFLPFHGVDDMTVEAVPGYWLETSTNPQLCPIMNENGEVVNIVKTFMFAYVPSKTQQSRKAKINNVLPDRSTWLKWPINFVLNHIFDNYQDARQEEIKLEVYPHSDLEGYCVQKTSQGRVKFDKKKWPGDVSLLEEGTSNDEGDDSDLNSQEVMALTRKKNKTFKKNLSDTSNIPSPPLSSDIISVVPSPPVCLPEEVTISDDIITFNIDDADTTLTSPSVTPSAIDNKTAPDENNVLNLPGLPSELEIELNTENLDLLSLLQGGRSNDDFYKACLLRILNQNLEMKKQIDRLEKIISEKLILPHSQDDYLKEMKELVSLPINSIEELQQINELLKNNSAYFTYLRNFMTDCCPIPLLQNQDSKTVRQELHKVVGHIFPRIISSALAVNLNLCGRTANPNMPKKEGMKKYPQILEAAFEAIKPRAKLANLVLNRSQTDSAIGEWLRLARNREPHHKESKRIKMAQKRAIEKNKLTQ